MKTNILIRVQARGGMFLGPDSFGGAVITIEDLKSGEVLANGFTDSGDSGTRVAEFNIETTPFPIVTPTTPNPTVYWVAAAPTTVSFAASLDLPEPTLLRFTARIPLPPAQQDQYVSMTSWVFPGEDLSTEAGLVMEVPGLWVQPEIVSNGLQLRLRAKVTMMCGCMINAKSPWIPEDFSVNARIISGKFSHKVSLTFEQNSQFTGEYTLPKAGDYQIFFEAQQKSILNSGVAVSEVKVG